jgi:hypothetical protein
LPEQVDAFLVAIHSTIAATLTVHVAAKCEDSPVHLHLQLADTVGSQESRELGIV